MHYPRANYDQKVNSTTSYSNIICCGVEDDLPIKTSILTVTPTAIFQVCPPLLLPFCPRIWLWFPVDSVGSKLPVLVVKPTSDVVDDSVSGTEAGEEVCREEESVVDEAFLNNKTKKERRQTVTLR